MDTSATTTTLVHRASEHDAWWRNAVIYQVYPRSFADASGDGIGDLPGVTSKLDHLARLGVDAVWLSPFYRSPQADAGYDVADYRDVDPLFGTLADFDEMIERAHRLGMRIIVDLVPNHTSDEHVWFQAALAADKGSPERARYIFRDGKGPEGAEPPNNWTSIFGGPAWTRIPDGQWYLHLFDTKQPDLDWTNPEVHEEMISVLRFWLDKGVDGFRVDVAHGMVKAEGLPDWAGHVSMVDGSDDGSTGAGNQGPMFDQDGVHEIYREWREVLDEYDGERILVAEAWVEPLSRLARYVRPDEMHQAFNFSYLTTLWDAGALRRVVTASLEANDAVGAPSTWVLSNHDVVRHPSRLGLSVAGSKPQGIGVGDEQPDEELGLRRARAATLLTLALPGSAYLYQGEELGLPEHTTLDDSLREDPAWARSGHTERGRDGCRVPLPWDADAPGLGFSPTGATWLPQPASWARYALSAQRGDPSSTYGMYRAALRIRRDFKLGSGSLAWVDGLPGCFAETTVAFVNGDVLVVANLGDEPIPVDPVHGLELLQASQPLVHGAPLPPDTTAWFRLPR
ncbi:MAG: glycoside hydrolase family 13 protein [Actinomycetales bacterium]|nr:glycoside hydrolase family 13 protein [Actinomycetales bacterium]